MTDTILYIALVAGVLALVLALYYTRAVLAAPQGNERMIELSTAIR
jgi:K(+)-stimulated pyrophosphate-energized sodium pump